MTGKRAAVVSVTLVIMWFPSSSVYHHKPLLSASSCLNLHSTHTPISITPPSSPSHTHTHTPSSQVHSHMAASPEPTVNSHCCCSQFPALLSPQSHDISTKKTAGVGDVFQSMKQQLLLLVEWAKHIPEFCSLPLDDRVTLLRTHSAEHLILGAARRSLPYNDLILLGNDFVIPLRGAQIEVSRVAFRIQEELVKPLRELDITDKEFACLKTIVFFAPDCPGLESPQLVRHLRFQAQLLLEEATSEQRGRFGELLLILPSLQSVAWQMVETLHLAQLLGEARMDSLLQEMLLGEGAKTEHGACTGDGKTQDQQRSSPPNFTSIISHVPTYWH
uniref:NR LBD domain-containing protein n=1 Tax=Lates calcarifer TaxID=8187 RepID=A0A4W6EFY8_LATCA